MKVHGVLKLLFLPAAILITLPCLAEHIPSVLKQTQNILSQQDSLKTEYGDLLNQSEILAQRIRLYRSKPSLNTREHRHLQHLLKEAQQISIQKKSIHYVLDTLSVKLMQIVKEGLKAIHAELANLTAANESRSIDSTAVRKIDQLLMWKAGLESYQTLYTPIDVNRLSLHIQDEDHAADLQIKGDMLLDREDRFRAEVALIDQRIRSLKIEADVRRKVRDMSSELEFFNEDEELLTRTVPVYSEDYPYNNIGYWDGSTEFREKITAPEDASYSLSEPIESNEKFEFEYLRTPEMIEQAIDKLMRYKFRLNAIADSLNQTAEQFYQEAKEREGSTY